MKQVIGFATKYYTLWEVSEPYLHWISKDYSVDCMDFIYIKNLSMDLNAAKAKVVGVYEIDLELCGSGSFTSTAKEVFNPDEFSFGNLRGKKISEADDVWQLKRAMGDEDTAERRKLAYNRLLELNIDVIEHDGYYVTREYLDELEKDLNSTELLMKSKHIGNVGDKYEGNVLVTDTFSFEGSYGWSDCFKMIDENDNLLIAFTTSKHFVGYWESGEEDEDGRYSNGYSVDGVNAGDKIRISGSIKKHCLRDEVIRLENGDNSKAAIKSTQIVRIKKRSE